MSWEDSSELVKAQWMRFGSQDGDTQSYQVRNIRNPDKVTETCINNVGSFSCASTEEEYIGLGWGGNSGGSYHFNVITADERSCGDHGIPGMTVRYSPVMTSLDNWLFICAGEYSRSCKKLDLNSENPSWSDFVTIPHSGFR